MSNELNSSISLNSPRYRRYVVAGLLIATLAIVISIGSVIRKQEPDFYAPGRAALVNARLRFEESLAHEQALIKQQRIAHEEMNLAISQLADAENLDPASRSQIEDIRTSFLAIEKATSMNETSPKNLQQQYRNLLDQIDALISRLESRSR